MKNVSSNNKFPQSPKSTKNTFPDTTVLNTMARDLSQILPKISKMSTIRILIYTLGKKHTLQTRIASFLDHEKSLKEVDSG